MTLTSVRARWYWKFQAGQAPKYPSSTQVGGMESVLVGSEEPGCMGNCSGGGPTMITVDGFLSEAAQFLVRPEQSALALTR